MNRRAANTTYVRPAAPSASLFQRWSNFYRRRLSKLARGLEFLNPTVPSNRRRASPPQEPIGQDLADTATIVQMPRTRCWIGTGQFCQLKQDTSA
jgi:hypothetical protein